MAKRVLNVYTRASLCLDKVTQWNENNNKLSRKDYESEIKRMKRLLLSYKGLLDVSFPFSVCYP